MSLLSHQLIEWLKQHSDRLDQSPQHADELLTRIAQAGIFKYGVPTSFGGDGSDFQKAVDAISEIAQYSLTAAFIAWGQRTFIGNLLASDNPVPRDLLLADLLAGNITAGTGLSNATKFLSGIEELNVTITERDGKCYLNGRLPWVTNLRRYGFLTTFAAGYQNGGKPIIVAIPSVANGLTRTEDLNLVALQGSNTAALIFDNVELDDDWILSHDAQAFLAKTRPEFLGLQCALPFGLAERCLAEVEKSLVFGSNRLVLQTEWEAQVTALKALKQRLADGLSEAEYFIQQPKELFKIRIEIVDVVAQSALLELQAGGGRGYLQDAGTEFIRRWREAAFLPVVTPSAVQLRLALVS